MQNDKEKRYYLKNSNLLEEIHKSKLTYCCYEKEEYGNYDIICSDYSLITPNVLSDFFESSEKDYVIVRVMTTEHVQEYCFCKDGKVNLQELKFAPFKHFLIYRSDFYNVYKSTENNSFAIEKLTDRINDFKEQIKVNNKYLLMYQAEKDKQVKYKEDNKKIRLQISDLTNQIKHLSNAFSIEMMKYAKEVLRSHWKGQTIESGHYDISQGKLTDTLVQMILLFVDQYAKSGNWAGYTYLDDLKGSALLHLCDVTLKFEESKSNNAFSYLTQCVANKFKAVLRQEKTQTWIKSQILQDAGYNPTFNEQTKELFQNILYDDNENEIDIKDIETNNEQND